MRKWLWIAPVILAAGCSRYRPAGTEQASTSSPGGIIEPASVARPVVRPETVIPSGTVLRVRVNETISTRNNRSGDRFTATLVDPVMLEGRSVLPVGTRMEGHVLVSSASGRLKGRAQIVLGLDSFQWEGKQIDIDTSSAGRVSGRHRKRNVIAIGGGAGLGAAIGAIAGGGKGALIGAGAGAAAGTIGAVATGKKQVTIPAESVVSFRLAQSVRV